MPFSRHALVEVNYPTYCGNAPVMSPRSPRLQHVSVIYRRWFGYWSIAGSVDFAYGLANLDRPLKRCLLLQSSHALVTSVSPERRFVYISDTWRPSSSRAVDAPVASNPTMADLHCRSVKRPLTVRLRPEYRFRSDRDAVQDPRDYCRPLIPWVASSPALRALPRSISERAFSNQ